MKRDAFFDDIRFNLNYILRNKEEYQKELLSLQEFNYGYWLVRIATECTLLLDRFIDIVWKKVGDLDKKPRTYFPTYSTEDKFEKYMKKIGSDKIKDDYPDLFEIIKNVQPFSNGETWLKRQYCIALERHSDPQRVYEYTPKNAICFRHIEEGKEVTLSVSIGGITKVAHIRRWGIPDQAPPDVIIKSKEEASRFIEECIDGTNRLLRDMINCFEKRL